MLSGASPEAHSTCLPLLFASTVLPGYEATAMLPIKLFATSAYALRTSAIIGYIDCVAMAMLLIRARPALGIIDVPWSATAAIYTTIPAVASTNTTRPGAIFHNRHGMTTAMLGRAARRTLRV